MQVAICLLGISKTRFLLSSPAICRLALVLACVSLYGFRSCIKALWCTGLSIWQPALLMYSMISASLLVTRSRVCLSYPLAETSRWPPSPRHLANTAWQYEDRSFSWRSFAFIYQLSDFIEKLLVWLLMLVHWFFCFVSVSCELRMETSQLSPQAKKWGCDSFCMAKDVFGICVNF